MKSAKDVNADDFEAFKGAGEKYWTQFFLHRRAVWERDQARDAARQAAAMFGQSIAPPSTTAGHVLASIRMPPLIADAWRTLAITGPAARTKLSTVVAARGLMDKATFHFKKSKTDPFGAEDITNVLQSFRRAESWRPLLAPELVGTWVTMNRLWQEVFRKFNV